MIELTEGKLDHIPPVAYVYASLPVYVELDGQLPYISDLLEGDKMLFPRLVSSIYDKQVPSDGVS